MCRVLSVKKSSYFSWSQVDHSEKEQATHEDHQLIEKAFFDLKENAGTRGIKGYLLHENDVRISRRKTGKILSTLRLKVKTQKKFKNKALRRLMIHELCQTS
jgi:putative transposase